MFNIKESFKDVCRNFSTGRNVAYLRMPTNLFVLLAQHMNERPSLEFMYEDCYCDSSALLETYASLEDPCGDKVQVPLHEIVELDPDFMQAYAIPKNFVENVAQRSLEWIEKYLDILKRYFNECSFTDRRYALFYNGQRILRIDNVVAQALWGYDAYPVAAFNKASLIAVHKENGEANFPVGQWYIENEYCRYTSCNRKGAVTKNSVLTSDLILAQHLGFKMFNYELVDDVQEAKLIVNNIRILNWCLRSRIVQMLENRGVTLDL